ncbi:MAG: FtsX-like permease family protein [Pseudomonadota bacterium]
MVEQVADRNTMWRWLMVGQFRSFPLRYIFTVVSIAIGVALGFSVHLINSSASDAFGDAVRNISGNADARITATSSLGFDEQLYAEVFSLPEVADVSPVVELRALLGHTRTRVRLLGIDPFRAGYITPLLLGRQDVSEDQSTGRTGGRTPFDLNAIYLSASALAETGVKVGDSLSARANGQVHDFVVAGDLPGIEAGQMIAVIDIATAQWRFDRLGKLDRLDVKRAKNSSQAALSEALSKLPAEDAGLGGVENEVERRDNLSRAYRVNLQMLALVALVTGGFLVYAAQSLSVQTRLRQFALLRIMGLQKTGLQRQLLIEGLTLGAIGSVIGLAFGFAIASLVLRYVGADLGAGYFSGNSAPIHISPFAILIFLGFGIGVAVFASFAPGRRAAALVPAQAIKSGADDGVDRKAPVWLPGGGLIIVGAAMTLLPAINDLPIFGYCAVAAILSGAIWLTPWLAATALKPLSGLAANNLSLDLALSHIQRSPTQSAIALGGIVASIGLMIAMAVMVSSFRTSVDNWLGSILSADLYASGGFSAVEFDNTAQQRIKTLPGINHAEFSRNVTVSLAVDRPLVNLIVRPVADTHYPLALIEEGRTEGIDLPIWISEPAARIYDLEIGDMVSLPIGGDRAEAQVVGIWSDYARQFGAIILESSDYTRLTGDTSRTEIAITLSKADEDNVTVEKLKPLLESVAETSLEVSDASSIRALALRLFDRSFAITYGLEAMAILIGMMGVAATFAAQVGSRIKEFGMLRHIGLTRRRIIAMLAWEGFLLGLLGLIAGLAAGFAISQILIHVINPQSFNLTMTTHLPLGLLTFICLGLVIVSALTAVIAGRRAASQDALRAVSEDW